jgi:hypothetical protein
MEAGAFPLNMTLCGGEHATVPPEYWYMPIGGSPYGHTYHMFPMTMCFAVDGYVYLLSTFVNLAVLAICLFSIAFLRAQPWQRRLLYYLTAVCVGVRFTYSVVAWARIANLKTMGDTYNASPFFRNTLIPVNAVADMFAAYTDILLARTWSSNRVTDMGARPMFIMFGATMAVFAAAVTVDAVWLADQPARVMDSDGIHVWFYTLLYVALFLFVTAVMHLFAIVKVMTEFFNPEYGRELRRQMMCLFVRAMLIATVVVCCSLFRAVVLVGRQVGIVAFRSGALSLDNADFTTVYFTLFIGLPTGAIAALFLGISVDEFRDKSLRQALTGLVTAIRGSVASGYSHSVGGYSQPASAQGSFAKSHGGESVVVVPEA